MPLFAIAAAAAGTGLFFKGKAAKNRRRAARLKDQARLIANVQRKRAFINRFRQAQADTLTAAVASQAGLESSAVRATQASLQTQKEVAVREFDDQRRLVAQAGKRLERASKQEFIGGVADTVASFALSGAFGGADPGTISEIKLPSHLTQRRPVSNFGVVPQANVRVV